MKRILFSSTVAALVLFPSTQLLAADYDQGVVTAAPTETYTDVEFGSGWYLRGDITFNMRGKSENTVTDVGGAYDPFILQANYDDVVGFRGGVGYRLSPYIRFDATAASILPSEFDGTRSQSFGGSRIVEFTDSYGNSQTDTVNFDSEGNVIGQTTGAYTGTTIAPIFGTDTVDAEYSVDSFIANGYLDLPISEGFIPYVGAGAGFSRVNYSETRSLVCTPDSTATCQFPSGSTGSQAATELTRDEEYWAFSYQLSVGAAIKLTERTSLDIGYSYLNVDGGDDLAYENGLAINDDGFDLHQGSIGIRYDIN